MPSLVIRPIPKENEYILGYVLRVIRENYIHDAYGFLSQFTHAKTLRTCLAKFLLKDFDLDLFCTYLKKDHQQILALYDSPLTELPLANIPTICSFCYQENSFINKCWISPLNVICEKHLVFLTNKCLECGYVFEWQHLQFHTCKRCQKPIVSSKFNRTLICTSPYLDYTLNKKRLFSESEKQVLGILSFFLLLTQGYTLYDSTSKFYRKHDFLQERILITYDNTLNFFLQNNLFENFLIQCHENELQNMDHLYTCLKSIDNYITDKTIKLKLLSTAKKCYFLKTKISKQIFKKLKEILDLNSSYHNDTVNQKSIDRDLFNLVPLFHFKYVTKIDKTTLILLIENSFIEVIKSNKGAYKYISIESLHKLMMCLKSSSTSLVDSESSKIIKFIDLSTVQKIDFLYFVVYGVGKPFKYEYDVLQGINATKILIE